MSAGLTLRVGTHVAQRDPTEMGTATQEVMAFMTHKVGNMNSNHVLNMDQMMPIPFLYHNKCMPDGKAR